MRDDTREDMEDKSSRHDAALDIEIGAALARHAARADRARAVAELIRAAGDFRWVGLYDVTEDAIAAVAWTGTRAPAFPRFPRSAGLNGAAVASGSTVVANDVANDPRYLTAFPTTGAEMIVPVRDDRGAVVGTIDVESPDVGAFGPTQRELVERCARLARPLWTASPA